MDNEPRSPQDSSHNPERKQEESLKEEFLSLARYSIIKGEIVEPGSTCPPKFVVGRGSEAEDVLKEHNIDTMIYTSGSPHTEKTGGAIQIDFKPDEDGIIKSLLVERNGGEVSAYVSFSASNVRKNKRLSEDEYKALKRLAVSMQKERDGLPNDNDLGQLTAFCNDLVNSRN